MNVRWVYSGRIRKPIEEELRIDYPDLSVGDKVEEPVCNAEKSSNTLGAGVDKALDDAERNGFRLAVFGRSIAIFTIGLLYFINLNASSGPFALMGALVIVAAGLACLAAERTRVERASRFAMFALDTIIIATLLAFVPLSSGGDVPQNLVFLTDRVQYFYIIIAAAMLTLSPALVIWTGASAVIGLLAATAFIVSGMESVLTFDDLALRPSREAYLGVVLDPNFIGLALRVKEALILMAVTALAAWGVQQARHMLRAHARAESERQRMEALFGRYVPASVVSELVEQGHLEPQMRDATLLFVDIEGFTRIAETMPPAKLVMLLNGLFSEITGIVDRNGGVVINYIGDAIIASFNAPLPAQDPAVQAMATANAILDRMSRVRFQGMFVKLRIGIATGPVAAGTVGSGGRQAYTLYGDTVNLAQRLESMNKQFGTRCLVCATTARRATSVGKPLRSLGIVSIRSRHQPAEVFMLR